MRCRTCRLAIFWAFYADRYMHTSTKAERCHPARTAVAAPKLARR